MNLAPLAVQKFFSNNGEPLNGGLLFTYASGSSSKIATYIDSTGVTQNSNPIQLDYRGECRVWLDPTLTYKFTLAPAGDTDPPTKPIWTVDNIASSISYADLTQQIIGGILWPRTAAEIAAGVTPTFYYYPPYDYRRYGAIDDGVTDNTALLIAVNTSFGVAFSGVFYIASNVLYNFNTVMAAIPGARYVLRDESLINAHNTPGFRQKIVGWSDGGDPTAVNDFAVRISSGHNACFILDNRGTAGSASANNGIAMVQWTRGELAIGQPDPRDLARYEFGQLTPTSWAWTIRRAAPWVARTWEYWEQGQVISGAGVYRRTTVGYYVSTGAGTTGATEPNWLSGTFSDGGVSWTTVLPNVDSSIFLADQWGQLATNTSTLDAVGLLSKADKYSPGGGQNNLYVEADGVSQTARLRLRPTDGAGAVVPFPYWMAQDGVGIRFLSNSAAIEFYRAFDATGLQILDTFSIAPSATAPVITNGTTITTTHIGQARVAPAGAVTGIILQAGVVGGQELTVINESAGANTVTFAASGTSRVADGVASVIAGLTARKFSWDASTSLWYPCK